jgi:hypothetical protein
MKKVIYFTVILLLLLSSASQMSAQRVTEEDAHNAVVDAQRIAKLYNVSTDSLAAFQQRIYDLKVTKRFADVKAEANRFKESCYPVSELDQIFVNDVDINAIPDLEYIELVFVEAKLFGAEVKVNIDYGQEMDWAKSVRLRDKRGQVIVFNTNMAGLNYMSKHGWEYINQNIVTSGGQNVYHYLMRRRGK